MSSGMRIEEYLLQTVIAKEFANVDVQVFSALESLADSGVRLKLKFPVEVLATYKCPMNWRESLKERFSLQWIRSRFPVKYDCIDIEACYPKISLKEEEHFFYVKHWKE